MNDVATKDIFSRRKFLETGSVALAAAGLLSAADAAAQDQKPYATKNDRSATDPGPGNPPLNGQNPDSAWPPATDSKSLVQTFKYPFSFANKRTYEGGWSREVTVRELPISKSMAGVNMRLTAGGVRELHWHTAAEWSIMLYGTARITAIDRYGKSFVADVKQNDLWFFPSGLPHSIQGLESDGAEFLLVFDEGDFSESDTVLLSDSMAHIPREVLSKNFGVAEEAFKKIFRGTNCLFFRPKFPGHWRPTRKQLQEHLGSHRRILPFGRWKFRRRSARKGARFALLIRASSRPQQGWRCQWSPFTREGSGNCTGTRTPTSGNTTSVERDE